MENSQISNASSGIRKTKFTCLKDQQCSLKAELEKKLEEVTEQLKHIIY